MKMLFKIYSLVEEYQKTYSFATLTRSFSDTPQLVNKNRQYARIFHGVITIYFKIFQHNAKAGLCPAFAHFGEDEK